MPLRRPLVRALGALLLLATGLRAQSDQTGAIRGRVTESETGAPVPNATVVVAQPDGSYGRTVRTDAAGSYRAPFLVPGSYVVRVRLVGFRPVELRGVRVTATQVATADVVLARAAVELAAVQVNAPTVQVERATAEVRSLVISERERELLPAPRDANSLLRFTPGARPGQLYGGSTDQANLYQLDGVQANQPGRGGAFLLPNVDWIQSLEVKGLGAGAEYGNFQGGLVNIVTKSGSNTWQGAVRTFVERAGFNASNINAFEQGSQLARRDEINAELRGPIIRDKLYFYASAQQLRSGTEVVNSATSTASGDVDFLPQLQTGTDQRFLGKLTWQATGGALVNASLGRIDSRTERLGLAPFDSPDATYQVRQPTTFYNLSWLQTLGARTSLEAKVSGFDGRDDQTPYNGSGTSAVKVLGAPGQFRNAFYTRNNRPTNLSGVLALDTWRRLAGMEHHLKVGGEWSQGRWDERRTRNGNLTWYYAPRSDATREQDASNPANWQDLGFGDGTYATSDWGGDIDLRARIVQGAAWVQDYIQVTRKLSLSPGLRFGLWQGFLTPGNGGSTLRGTDEFKAVSATGIDPRIGVNYDVTGEGTFVLKGHWGRYRQNMFAFMFDRAPGGNVFTDIVYYDWNDKTKANLPDLDRAYTLEERARLFTNAGGASLFNEARGFRDYRQPYMDQVTLGVEKAIGRNHKIEINYVNRRNFDVLSLVDPRLDRNWSPLSNVTVTRAGQPVLDERGQPLVLPTLYVRNDDLRARLRAGDVIPGYTRADTARLSYNGDSLVITTVPQATRKFEQLQVVLSGVLPRVTWNAALAFTRLEGNVFSVNGYDNPSGQGVGPFVAPNAGVNLFGRLPNASPIDFKLRMSGQLPWGFQGGAFFTYTSGDAWTPFFIVQRRNLTYTLQNPAGGTARLDQRLLTNVDNQSLNLTSRGANTFPPLTQLDLRLEKAFRFGGTALIGGLEMFNVFNANTVVAVKQNVNDVIASDPTSAFGATRLRLAPRTLRLNLQVRY